MKSTFMLSLLCSAIFLVACNSGSGTSSSSTPKYLAPGNYTATASNFSSTGNPPIECDSEGFIPISPVSITESGVECAGGQCEQSPINLNNNPCFSTSQLQDGIVASQTYNNCAVSASNVFTTTETISFVGNNTTIGTCSFTYTLTPQ
ncbi:MAG: hypothetical protein QG673_1526 [Pseudomonadota bacterium]|jgi:hypothetical protein|nr:hypothetical protein [Burkholderiales bacterium]MDQ5921468.1 hypothetical protein [Pseudomonadota bacterium]